MQQIRIINTFYDSGEPKYLAGQSYPIDEDTERQLAKGNGERVDMPADAEPEQAGAPAEAAVSAPEQPQDETTAAAPAPAAPAVARKRAATAA